MSCRDVCQADVDLERGSGVNGDRGDESNTEARRTHGGAVARPPSAGRTNEANCSKCKRTCYRFVRLHFGQLTSFVPRGARRHTPSVTLPTSCLKFFSERAPWLRPSVLNSSP